MAYSHPHQREFTNLSFGPESAFKTGRAVTDVSGWIGILMEEIDLPYGKPEQKALYTSGHTDSDTVLGGATAAGAKPITVIENKRTYQGKLAWICQNRQLFQEIFGKKYTTLDSPSAGYNTHTFIAGTVSARPLPSITLVAWNDKAGDGFTDVNDFCQRFIGVKLGKTTFSANEGEELKIESDLFGTTMDDQIAFPAAFTEIATKPYLFNEGALTVFSSTFTRIKSLSIDIDHKLKELWYASVDPYDLVEQRVEMKATITVVMDDDTLWNLQNTKPTGSTRFSFTFTRTASQDTLTLESEPSGTTSFAYPVFTPKPVGGEGEIEVDIEFMLTNLRCQVIDNISTNHVY